MSINNVAICYYGMTRSLKSVYKSHQENLINILNDNHTRYEIFMHTWNTGKYNIIGDKLTNVPIDYQEYKVLNPKYYQIDNQSEFINTINIEDYFNNDLYTNGEKRESNPKLIYNHLCALESIKRVTKMVEASDINRFDTIIYIRPDILLLNKFSMNWFIYFNPTQIMLLNYDHNEGYNDKFAVLHLENYKAYGYRIDKLKEYRKKMGRITPEKFVKYIVLRNYKQIKFIDFEMKIITPYARRNFTDENTDSINFKDYINMYTIEDAYVKVIKDIFSIQENNSISINIDTNIYQVYKDGIWINSNWDEISNYLYNRYIFYLKYNFDKIKGLLEKNKIINYNRFFYIGLKNESIVGINQDILNFFNDIKN
jgi:hypothetical protein